MPKIILFNKSQPSENVGILLLVKENRKPSIAELPSHDEIADEIKSNIKVTSYGTKKFLFGYFINPIDSPDVLDIFKSDFFDWNWIDLEKFYESPLQYFSKSWIDEMDRDDFLIFIKNKDKILEQFDKIKTS